MNQKNLAICGSLNLKQYLKKKVIAMTYSLHACSRTLYKNTQTHTLNSTTNGPQWVGYKVGDVMSVMATVCPFTNDPFLIQLSSVTQSREKE